MGAGFGVWQRLILEAVAEQPHGVPLTTVGAGRSSEAVAVRRAARGLEARGLIRLDRDTVDGAGAKRRLIAYPVSA